MKESKNKNGKKKEFPKDERKGGRGSGKGHRRGGYKPKPDGQGGGGTPPPKPDAPHDSNNLFAGVAESNHPAWYNKFPTLVNAYASIPFTNPLGAALPEFAGAANYYPGYVAGSASGNPGIMVFDVIPNPGISKDTFSPVNVASGAFYTKVRYKQSGQGTYDRSDLMMYVLAIDSCYTLWAEAVRAYSVMLCYSFSNRYYARYLIEALGFDFDDLSGHLPLMRGLIDEFAQKIAQFNVPAGIDYTTRHLWQFGNLFKDSPSVKAQLYAVKPYNYWKFDELADVKGSKCTPIYRPANMTLQMMEDIMIEQFNAIYYSSTMMNAAGDIGKAYDGSGLMKIASISEHPEPPIQLDAQTCMEIQNMIVVGEPIEGTNELRVDNDLNAIVYNPAFPITEIMTEDFSKFAFLPINVRHDAPTSDDVMKATRMMYFAESYDEELGGFTLHSSGTEVCTRARMYFLTFSAGEYVMRNLEFTTTMDNNIFSQPEFINVSAMLEKFNYHPYVYYFSSNTAGDRYLLGWIGDVDNVTFVDRYTLDKIHEAAIMSLFFSDGMGNFIRS